MSTRHAIALALGCGAVALLLPAACTDAPSEPKSTTTATSAPALQSPAAIQSGTVVVTVGREGVGTDYFPPGSHDGSYHAKDAIRPRSTVIAAGTTVDFVIAAGHDVSVYEPGIGVEDIDTGLLEPAGVPFPFPPLINDPAGRLARAPLNFGPPLVWSYTFEEPGLHLVICDVLPHFADSKMYAWIRVK
jgi:plastocyanin